MPTITDYVTRLRVLRDAHADAAIPFVRAGGLASDISVADDMAFTAFQAHNAMCNVDDEGDTPHNRREAERLVTYFEDILPRAIMGAPLSVDQYVDNNGESYGVLVDEIVARDGEGMEEWESYDIESLRGEYRF